MLKDVDEKTLYLIASKMTPYRFGPGTDLCTEGDAADRLWVLLEGERPGGQPCAGLHAPAPCRAASPP